jgi:hypothetical protein
MMSSSILSVDKHENDIQMNNKIYLNVKLDAQEG